MEEEVFEVYSDNFEAIGNAYGLVLNFSISPPSVQPGQAIPQARIRLSWEMAKVFAFMLARYIKQGEAGRGVSYPMGTDALNKLSIPLEDWDTFWRP